MSLSYEQSLEVVQKIWGWTWYSDGEIQSDNEWEWQGRWLDSYGSVALYQRDISGKVNSWEGVGETIESIDPGFRGHLLSVIDMWRDEDEQWYTASDLVEAIQCAAWDFIQSGPIK